MLRTILVSAFCIGALLPLQAAAIDLVDCGYLSQSGAVYTLRNDVSSNGGCFFITASGITLDLNGHTVTYDNAPPIVVPNGSFETDLAGTWNLAGAGGAGRFAGTFVDPVTLFDGSYSLKVTTPTADQAVTSIGSVNLKANTRYSLSAMVYNQVNDAITMSVEFNDTLKAIQKGKTNRGFQYISYEFVTGATDASYSITLRVTGAGAVGAGAVYFDDVRVQRNRLVGVMVGPVSWRALPVSSDAKIYGTATNATVMNGTIKQGAGRSDWSPGLATETNSTSGHTFQNLTISTVGANSQAINLQSAQNMTIANNTLSADMSAITSRDNINGAVVTAHGYNTKITGNTITQGVQTGIYANSLSGQVPQEISGNVIELQGRYTNNFAISGNGSMIHDNKIACGTGNNSCRGIFAGGQGTSGTKVWNNVVEVQELPRNQEYGKCQNYGAYGIQTENTSNTEVYGNTVTAYSDVCEAHAYRANPEEGSAIPVNNMIHDNTFTGIANGPARASAMKISGAKAGEITIYRNTFQSNRRWIFASFDKLIDSLPLTNNKWETVEPLDNPFYPFENYNYLGSYVKDMIFLNNTYGAGDKDRFEKEYFRSSTSWPNKEPNSSFRVQFTVTPPTNLRPK